jgi:hypothetical protein
MSEYWDTYFGFIDEKPAAIVLDMEVSQEIDTELYKHAQNEDGFHVGSEAGELNEIEHDFKESAELQKIYKCGNNYHLRN